MPTPPTPPLTTDQQMLAELKLIRRVLYVLAAASTGTDEQKKALATAVILDPNALEGW